MTDLTAFLLARIEDLEANAPESGWTDDEGRCNYCGGEGDARVLATCAAYKVIVAERKDHAADVVPFGVSVDDSARFALDRALRALASIWAGHPAYDTDWRLS